MPDGVLGDPLLWPGEPRRELLDRAEVMILGLMRRCNVARRCLLGLKIRASGASRIPQAADGFLHERGRQVTQLRRAKPSEHALRPTDDLGGMLAGHTAASQIPPVIFQVLFEGAFLGGGV